MPEPVASGEAMAAAEAAWHAVHSINPAPEVQAWGHELWQAAWSAALAWAAQQAEGLKFRLYRPAKDGPGGGMHALDVIPAHELLGLLRQDGGT